MAIQGLETSLPVFFVNFHLMVALRAEAEINQLVIQPDIMTIEGGTRFLSLPLNEVIAVIDQLPAIEISGRIRFRRDRIQAWIEEHESRRKQELDAHNLLIRNKIIAFPGC